MEVRYVMFSDGCGRAARIRGVSPSFDLQSGCARYGSMVVRGIRPPIKSPSCKILAFGCRWRAGRISYGRSAQGIVTWRRASVNDKGGDVDGYGGSIPEE